MNSPCSVLILTLNEEINIRGCLRSVDWCDDVVVLDSYSEDVTVKLCEEAGSRVVKRRFDNWSNHQNWAMKNISFAHDWVLYIDADERCTQELQEEIFEVLDQAAEKAAFRVRRKDFFGGRWPKHAQLYPTWLIRLFRPERVRYERLVNPVTVVDGEVGFLEGHLHHYPFSHGIAHWIERHNRYSGLEARETFQTLSGSSNSLPKVFHSDPNVRRQALKELFAKVPARPLLKFFYYFVVRKGFLDGHVGITYCFLQAIYEYFIVLKVRELKGKY